MKKYWKLGSLVVARGGFYHRGRIFSQITAVLRVYKLVTYSGCQRSPRLTRHAYGTPDLSSTLSWYSFPYS
jgi:hypothetical protein